MFLSYFKTAVRNLKRQRVYSFINIAGLSIGMACTILILLWVQDELSYDRFHHNADRLYRVTGHEKYTTGEEVSFSMNPAALAPTLLQEYPEITNVARLRRFKGTVVQYGQKRFSEDGLVFVDPAFLDMFTVTFIEGTPEDALSEPHSLVVTQEMAAKYFGEENPLGKTIRIDNRLDFLISGVIENIPDNSHLKINFLAPFETIKEFGYETEGWNSFAYTTYVLLDGIADYKKVSKKITNLVIKYEPEAIVRLSLQPLPDIHLRSGTMWGIGGTGDIKYVYIFSIIAGFILLLACINFMNLATARAGTRAKEVGLRKVVGARRTEIIKQFYSESFLFVFIALIFTVVLVLEFLPAFNSISGKQLVFDIQSDAGMNILLLILAIAVITAFISGSYPALVLSAFRPVRVLKGTLSLGTKNSLFRQLLVSFQFILTVILIIGTIVINRQLHAIKDRKLAFDKEHVLSVRLPGELNRKMNVIKDEIGKTRQVLNVSAVSFPPARIQQSTVLSEWEGRHDDEQFLIYMLSADFEFANTLNIAMASGRYFSREFPADTSEGFVINEAAASAMGMDAPLGKKIFDGRIIGVIKDFHFASLHSDIGPLIIYFDPREIQYLLLRINGKDISNSIKAIEAAWNRIAPEFPFEYSFLNDQIDALYSAEQQVEKIINVFSFLALLIACLGLFGLSSFAAEQRRKEVGIRKALGATVSGIVMLLSKEFAKYVLLSNIVAWPIAYYAMNSWLQNFAYRIDMGYWVFVLAGGIAFLVAFLTVSSQTIKAAVANPVRALRYE